MNEKIFGTMPTKQLFFKLSIPSLFSMLFTSINILIDGVFVGNFIGGNGLASINMVFPFIMILFAVGDMFAIGSSVKVSILLGKKREKKACQLFSASCITIWGFMALFMLVGILFGEQILSLYITDEQLLEGALRYANVYFYTLPLVGTLFSVDNFLRVCGKAKFSMWINISVAILNIILDALLIGYFKMGIEASAIASVVSMSLGTLVAYMPFIFKKVTLHFTYPKVRIRTMVAIAYNGFSEFLNNIAGNIISLLTNYLLLKLGGSVAVQSYAIIMYIDVLLISMLYGILDSLQPAVSYNLGAKKIDRTLSLFRIGAITSFSLSIVVMSAMLIFPDFWVGIFSHNAENSIKEVTKNAIYLFAPSYSFVWFNMISSSFLTSFDKPKASLTIMLLRSIILPVLFLFVLTKMFGFYGIYLVPTVSGAFTIIVAIIIWQKNVTQLKKEYAI